VLFRSVHLNLPIQPAMKLTLALSLLTASTAAFSSPFGARQSLRSVQRKPSRLFGILDEINSDAFDLTSSSAETDVNLNDSFEMFLADLVFSTNDPRVDVVNNFDRAADDIFVNWLDAKVKNSRDPEERLALRDLYDIIIDVKEKMQLSEMAQDRMAKEAEQREADRLAEAESMASEGRKMSNTDVLKKALAINTAGSFEDTTVEQKKVSFYDQELTPEIRMSYDKTLKKILPPYKAGETTESVVFNAYEQFDAQFVKVWNERAVGGDHDCQVILECLANEQQKRLTVATEALRSVLSLGDPMRMEGAIVKMAREGKIDEPFLLLLEANATQARDAGATGPAQLMERLRKRASEEKDKQASSKEIRLIRQLLRAADGIEREKILVEAFTPKDVLLVAGTPENAQKALDGERPDEQKPMPDVPPPDFVNACKAVLLNFGNLDADDDRGDLATRIKNIASEAEVVATRIYGKGMSLREQQDRAWKEQTTSIFDLETLEIEAERNGESAPWANPEMGDEILPGFDAGGRMRIGGQ